MHVDAGREKGVSGLGCLFFQFRSSVLFLFFRGCPRVWPCCSPLVAVSLLFVPSVRLGARAPLECTSSGWQWRPQTILINRVVSTPRCDLYLFGSLSQIRVAITCHEVFL